MKHSNPHGHCVMKNVGILRFAVFDSKS